MNRGSNHKSRASELRFEPHLTAIWGNSRGTKFPKVLRNGPNWGAANGGLRDGGLSKSEENGGKRPSSSVFWISQVLLVPSGNKKRQKKADFGRFPGRAARHPLSPHLLHPHLRQPNQTQPQPYFSKKLSISCSIKTTLDGTSDDKSLSSLRAELHTRGLMHPGAPQN